jgi:hypothetical protein
VVSFPLFPIPTSSAIKKKNPNDPEAADEGHIQIDYSSNNCAAVTEYYL